MRPKYDLVTTIACEAADIKNESLKSRLSNYSNEEKETMRFGQAIGQHTNFPQMRFDIEYFWRKDTKVFVAGFSNPKWGNTLVSFFAENERRGAWIFFNVQSEVYYHPSNTQD